ncbi:hypothetical protein CONCODRAFT_80396 [Conidiobolus coronatus NRRL 28638]|uniref:Uncharacterized protein n=1 Tax=Conidiobolus coronatus (strain ATCC 28846 / CBS 209.66 / NRRL 28638) TaxID=796925 RepID=A0A137NVY0_CONC2|nr:hypothetical protein CONCODRAFT_80396 [Conidiobolus coronatus NRRL 28638]|eukprot:KXN66789.1 hypothetical protein CONCODRAFT_80396 [Conidiobolus coronatus NRRL 28638]
MGYKQTLVGNTNRGQILAQITDNVLSLSKEGTVIVANCVPSDYHKVIVATSAFIWMKKHNRK